MSDHCDTEEEEPYPFNNRVDGGTVASFYDENGVHHSFVDKDTYTAEETKAAATAAGYSQQKVQAMDANDLLQMYYQGAIEAYLDEINKK